MIEVKEHAYGQTHHVNMGNFEWTEFKSSVTVVGTEGETDEELRDAARAFVEAQLADDLERALTVTAEEDTYVEPWVDGPRRSTRKVTRRPRRTA